METETRERPILFNGAMARAILAGTKTQTRRVMKPQPKHSETRDLDQWTWSAGNSGRSATGDSDWFASRMPAHCPYGGVGDRLWVRETWMPSTENGVPVGEAIYRATDKPEPDGDTPLKWRPSIFMPRALSRITLEITGVRVERVQDISEADAQAEGVTYYGNGSHRGGFVMGFGMLWDTINEKRGYSWKSNPWVWAVSFQRVQS